MFGLQYFRVVIVCASLWFFPAYAETSGKQAWQENLAQSKGKTVYFHAWGGSQAINAYIQWVSQEVKKLYQIDLKHVKINDVADSIAQLVNESKNKQLSNIDILWVNGENFSILRKNDLLPPPFVNNLPNSIFLNQNPSFRFDFTIPTNDQEMPWGTAQLVFLHTPSAQTQSHQELLAWAQNNPGRFTYPAPPNFHGTTFIKQVLLNMTNNDFRLFVPPTEEAKKELLPLLFTYLDTLHPLLWQKGQTFPNNQPQLLQLLANGQIDIALSFNPYEGENLIKNKKLPKTIQTSTWLSGTVGNVHYLTTPKNSKNHATAFVVMNFLLSPQAQARKANPDNWGDPSVLAIDNLDKQDRSLFATQRKPLQLSPLLSEPHPEWVNVLEKEWQKKYY